MRSGTAVLALALCAALLVTAAVQGVDATAAHQVTPHPPPPPPTQLPVM